jgi:hypothetical protein
MKTFLTISLGILFFFAAKSQNIQLHYDFGEDRQMPTTTIEMFRPDSIGSTFFFVDFNYGGKTADVNGVSLAYTEISRNLRFWDIPIEVHAEYDGGFGQFKITDTTFGAYTINHAALLGATYTIHNKDFSRVFTLQVLYKYIDQKNDAAFQVTGVWGLHFFNRKVSFTGFADFWREDNMVFDDDGNASEAEYVFLSEPQLWYNFTKNISLGGEIEISSNFGGNKGFMVNPTLGAKWIF